MKKHHLWVFPVVLVGLALAAPRRISGQDLPVMTSVSPQEVLPDFSNDLVVFGNFQPDTRVTIIGVGDLLRPYFYGPDHVGGGNPLLPDGVSTGWKDVVARDSRGETVLPNGIFYLERGSSYLFNFSPAEIPPEGGTRIRFYGWRLRPGFTPLIGGVPLTDLVIDPYEPDYFITGTAPDLPEGYYEARIRDDATGTLIPGRPTYAVHVLAGTRPPQITGVEPVEVDARLGVALSIQGEGFRQQDPFTIGTQACFISLRGDGLYAISKCMATSFISETLLAGTVEPIDPLNPATPPGPRSIAIWDERGYTALPDALTYVDKIRSVSPATVALSGGTPVTINGFGFQGGFRIRLDNSDLTNQEFVDASTFRGTSPPLPAGRHPAYLLDGIDSIVGYLPDAVEVVPDPVPFQVMETGQLGCVTLDWTGYDEASQGGIDRYAIYVQDHPFVEIGGLSPLAEVPAGTFARTVCSLTEGQPYWFSIVAVGSGGSSLDTVMPVPWIPGGIPLELDTPVTVSMTPESPRRFFRLERPAEDAVLLALTDPDPGDSNALYVRRTGPPAGGKYDQAADARSRPNQSLVVPFFQGGVLYILVQATGVQGGSNVVTLEARRAVLALERLSATYAGQGGDGRLHAAIVGAGFNEGTSFTLANSGGEIFGTSEKVIVSAERAEVAFALVGAPVGSYDLRARNPGGSSAFLAGAFEVQDTRRGPILEVALSAPERYRYDRLARMTLRYGNAGDQEMTAPLFKVVGPPETDLRLETDDEFQGNVLQVLGVDPTGVAGKLAPGSRGEIPIVFRNRSDSRADFSVYLFAPGPGDFVGWDELPGPQGLDPARWGNLWVPLSARLGASWSEYRESLAEEATRLARRGADASSVLEVFRFAAREALGMPSSAVAGRVLDVASAVPLAGVTVVAFRGGEAVASAVTSTDGLYLLDRLTGGEAYDLRVVDRDAGAVMVSVPAGGDLLGLNLLAGGSPVSGLAAVSPSTGEDALPGRPLLPPEDLFVRVEDRGLSVVRSWDPNEKEGPSGEVGESDALTYQIFFENLPSATAWAQTVVVTDQLETALDWGTFRPREVRIGGATLVSLDVTRGGAEGSGIPIASDDYSGFQMLQWSGPQGAWLLDISGEFDPGTGLATWTFETLDPTTGAPPDPSLYPDEGFLPPNKTSPQGEASVVFTVSPKADLDDGTEITNQATISFDGHPLSTPAVNCTFRRSLPAEAPHLPFPPSGTGREVEVDISLSWQSSADSFDVHLWKEGEAPAPVASGITVRSFRPAASLAPGTEYRWQVVARKGATPSIGEIWDFRTMSPMPPPQPPVNRNPLSGAASVPLEPILEWSPAAGASTYTVFLWPHGAPRPERGVVAGISGDRFECRQALEAGAMYDWQVVAENRSGRTEGIPTTFRAIGAFRRGDVNADGEIDIGDPIFDLFFLFAGGREPPCRKSQDANDDGLHDLSDIIFILDYLFRGGAAPAAPFAACGPDPTDDPLACDGDPVCP